MDDHFAFFWCLLVWRERRGAAQDCDNLAGRNTNAQVLSTSSTNVREVLAVDQQHIKLPLLRSATGGVALLVTNRILLSDGPSSSHHSFNKNQLRQFQSHQL